MNSEKRRTVFFRAFWRIVILLFVMIPLLWGGQNLAVCLQL